eukprot:1153597-Pelagomonas_calceolata.AAC.1
MATFRECVIAQAPFSLQLSCPHRQEKKGNGFVKMPSRCLLCKCSSWQTSPSAARSSLNQAYKPPILLGTKALNT